MNFFIPSLWILLGAYLIGSFPAGYLAGRCCHIDIRQHGSGNIGATNVMRVLGKKWGYSVFVLDLFKGWLAVFGAMATGRALHLDSISLLGAFAAISVLVGHSFPIWLGFCGGKGISTSAGVIVALFPASFLICCGSWIIFFYLTRIVSIASIVASLLLPISVIAFFFLGLAAPQLPSFFQQDGILVGASLIMGTLAVTRHRKNIERLFAGTEPRFERKKKI